MEEILVVEDDTALATVVATVLADEGYQVATAANGREALALAEQHEPRLILLDMRMPIMNGWEFASAYAQRGHHSAILVMTAAEDAGRWAAEIGAQGYLAKPFDLDDLIRTVGRLAGPPA